MINLGEAINIEPSNNDYPRLLDSQMTALSPEQGESIEKPCERLPFPQKQEEITKKNFYETHEVNFLIQRTQDRNLNSIS